MQNGLLRCSGVIVITIFFFLSNISLVLGQVTIFQDGLNSNASDSNWINCSGAYSYQLSPAPFEGNASLRKLANNDIFDDYDPLYHEITGLNTTAYNYTVTGYFYDFGGTDKQYFISTDTSLPCNTGFGYGAIGVRTPFSVGNYVYFGLGVSFQDSGISRTVGWHKYEFTLSYHNTTHNWAELSLDSTLLRNVYTIDQSNLYIQLHDGGRSIAWGDYGQYDNIMVERVSVNATYSGYIGGIPNANSLELTARLSYVYVGNVEKSIYINQTIFNIVNYTNVFGDTWVSIVLYSASNSQAISSVNPLIAIWQNTTLIHSGTVNQLINYYPNIITQDEKYIAIAFSSTQDIELSASFTSQTMYTYPVYAPYSIDYLDATSDKLGIRFIWGVRVPITYPTSTPPTYVNDWDILNQLNTLFVQIGLPSIFMYSMIFVIVLLAVLIILSKAKKDSGDYGKMPPVMLGVFSFSILAFFSVSNMLPFELLIFVILGVTALFAIFTSKLVLGGEE